ncbi:MAG: hypothetical protein ACOYXC_14150 [Candidatus Rifleibacteriota bacterium]
MKFQIAAGLLIAVLLQFVFSIPLHSCDVDSFVYEEFGQRCLRLSGFIKELQTSYRFNLPDQDKFRRQLLNEWTDFFLDHGEGPPPGMSQIATESWKQTIVQTGQQIGKLTYRQIEPQEADWTTIPFFLLSQPPKLEQVRQALASWSELLEMPVCDSVASESAWIGSNMYNLAQISNLTLVSVENEKERVLKLVREINYDWGHVVNAPSETADTIFRFSRDEIRAKLKKEFEHWRKLSFW